MQLGRLLDGASELLARVLQSDRPADRETAEFFRRHRHFGPRERRLLADVAYEILRRRHAWEFRARSGPGPLHRRLAILALAARQPELVAVLGPEEAEWLAGCAEPSPGEQTAACRHNLPPWLAQALEQELGHEFDALAQALLQPAPLDLRVNTLRMKPAAARQALAAAGIRAQPTPHAPLGLRVHGHPSLRDVPVFTSGGVDVQDEGSQLLALLPGARRGQLVADFCAGAGGKTLALGAAMRNQGHLYALDVSQARLRELQMRARRAGLTNIYTMALEDEDDARLQRLAGRFDSVLVDAPCTGLGTLRRSPDLKWRRHAADVPAFAALQARILVAAARLVKPGGRLVYATCSLLQAENEQVASAFEDSHTGTFVPLSARRVLERERVADAAALCDPGGRFLRLWPHRHGTDGFFAALWQRRV